MKILCSIAAILISLTLSAQTLQSSSTSYTEIVPTTVNNNLLFTWDASTNADATFYVQASNDGKNYKTIGIVWGTTPELNNICMFKENKNKLNKSYTKFRIYMEPSVSMVSK